MHEYTWRMSEYANHEELYRALEGLKTRAQALEMKMVDASEEDKRRLADVNNGLHHIGQQYESTELSAGKLSTNPASQRMPAADQAAGVKAIEMELKRLEDEFPT